MKFTIFFTCLYASLLNATLPEDTLVQAYENYLIGEQAETIVERSAAFNEALKHYTTLEQQLADGRLFYNIGNCYFQLGEYPWAILYYHRALEQRPRDQKIQSNLAIAQQRVGIVDDDISIAKIFFFFHHRLAPSERLFLFALSSICALLIWTLNLWSPNTLFRLLKQISGLITIIPIISIAYTHYFSPIYGICVEATPLYRDMGTHYAHVRDKPLLPGSKIEVIEVLKEGTWLKVVTSEGTLGFVSAEVLRLI